MGSWWCKTKHARQELLRIIEQGRYVGVPLPAYGVAGGLIPPRAYESALKGAVVQVKAVLTHQYFAGPKTDNFFADIRELKVIKRPPPLPVSSSKRKFMEDVQSASRGNEY